MRKASAEEPRLLSGLHNCTDGAGSGKKEKETGNGLRAVSGRNPFYSLKQLVGVTCPGRRAQKGCIVLELSVPPPKKNV